MAKILVADDNSNVQKTVALALADMGVEVESVNNGEAAVRKLASFSPDLVLADIFMPVRSGYEVCEYIKKDAHFSHVPVVLLVGAFDPLDEREAQRVGSDGILKKPFVPPEPLITMVKTLLDRSMNERLVTVSASKAVASHQERASRSGTAIAEESLPQMQTFEDSPAQDFQVPAGRVDFAEGEHPVAFSQLLKTAAPEDPAPAAETVEPVNDDQILTSARDAALGDPIFWRNDESTPEPEPEAHQSENASVSPAASEPAPVEKSLPQHDEGILIQPVEPLELVREQQEDTSESVVESAPILLEPAAQADLNVDSKPPEDLAANPLEWMATAPPQPAGQEEEPENKAEQMQPAAGWDTPIPDAGDAAQGIESPEHSQSPEAAPVSSAASEEISGSEKGIAPAADPLADTAAGTAAVQPDAPADEKAPEPVKPAETHTAPWPAISAQRAEDTVRSISKEDWADLTETMQAGGGEAVSEQHSVQSAETSTEQHSSQAAEMTAEHPAAESESSKQDWADLTETMQAGVGEAISEQHSGQSDETSAEQHSSQAAAESESTALVPAAKTESNISTPEAHSTPVVPDADLVEAVVQRILEKVRPQVVDIITKEFLRPIVHVLVQREIEKQ